MTNEELELLVKFVEIVSGQQKKPEVTAMTGLR